MGTGIVLDLLQQGKPDEALAAYQRYYARRHTSRTKDYPAARPRWPSWSSSRPPTSGSYNDAMIETTLGLAKDGVIDRLQMHFYERWDAAPLLVDFVRSRIPADMPIEAWEVGLFDVDETNVRGASSSDEVTKTVSQLLAYGVARVLWLPLAADPNGTGGEEKRFGLLEPDGTPRPGGRRLPSSWSGSARGATLPAARRRRACSASWPARVTRPRWWRGPRTRPSRPTGPTGR